MGAGTGAGPGGSWTAIRAEVMARIARRDWVPGQVIPGEEALAAEFGCARATVNRALADLAASGVLERRRKAGTRVALLPVRRATLEIPVIRLEVEAKGQVYSHRLLSRGEGLPPVPVASALGHDGPMLHLLTLHLADGRPFALEDRWLNPAAVPPLPDFAAISANEWLVSHVAYASGDIAFSAEPAGADEAAALGVTPGAALFVTERITRGPEAPITFVRLAHAPGYRLRTGV